MQNKISRRSIVKSGLIAGALLPVAGLVSRGAGAAALPPLDPNDPTAKALGFVNDGSKRFINCRLRLCRSHCEHREASSDDVLGLSPRSISAARSAILCRYSRRGF